LYIEACLLPCIQVREAYQLTVEVMIGRVC
jgi:hypothetical protein